MNPLRRRNARIRQLADDLSGVWGTPHVGVIPRNVPGDVLRAVLARLRLLPHGLDTFTAYPDRDAPLVTRAGMA